MKVANVGGNTAANGTFTITKVDDDKFSRDTSAGNGTYTSGGDWHVLGAYQITVIALGATGYETGEMYRALFEFKIATAAKEDQLSFAVV